MNPSHVIIHHNISAAPPHMAEYNATDGGSIHKHHRTFLHRSFYWGTNAQFLFSGWPGSSHAMYALAILFVFVLAILVEWLAEFNVAKPGSNRVAAGLFRTGIHLIRAGLAYIVLLSVMSYNGGVFIAAVLGHAIGYLFFGSQVFKMGSGKQ